MFLREFFEAVDKADAAFAFGRFNPAHQGHVEVYKAVESAGDKWFIGTNPTTHGPNDPLTFEEKSAWMQTIYPAIKGHLLPEKSVLTVASKIYKMLGDGKSIAYVTDSNDWAWSGKLLNDYNGKEGPHGYYNFRSINHVESPRVSSATALRTAARAGDEAVFYAASGTDPKLTVNGKTYYETVAAAVNANPEKVKKAVKKKEPVAAEGILDVFKDKPLPTKPETIKLGNFVVELEPSSSHIGFAWRDSSGREHYEEVSTVGNEFSANTRKELISKIKDEIKHQERQLKKQREGSNQHISPSGVKTNMDPSDDDYDINYGKNGLVAKFRKAKGVAEGSHPSDDWETISDIESKTGKVLGLVLQHLNGTYGFYDVRKSNIESGFSSPQAARQAFVDLHNARRGVAEVSKDTLDRYVTKAVDAHGHADFAARMSKDDPTLRSYHKDQKKTAEKRQQGISRALDRMARNVDEGFGDYGFKIGDWEYRTESEDYDDVTKIHHTVIMPSGSEKSIDFSPYETMTKETFKLWVKLGMPTRKDIGSRGPLNNKDIIELSRSEGIAKLDKEMARAGMGDEVIPHMARDLENPPKVMQHRAKRDQEREQQYKSSQLSKRNDSDKDEWGDLKDSLRELSSELLGRYKRASSKDATASDNRGDFKRGDKRFSGIIKATKKQFDNDLKGKK
jgi:hypothetical protein